MASKLIRSRGGITFALVFLAAATLLWVANAQTVGSTAKNTMQWGEQASKELMAALHHTHEVANAGEIEAVKQSYVGDNALVTLAPRTASTVPVGSSGPCHLKSAFTPRETSKRQAARLGVERLR